MLERNDLPLRDLLGVVIPGLVGSTYVVAGLYVANWDFPHAVSSVGAFLMLALLVGLFGFTLGVHMYWPWRRDWDEELKNIREDLVAITNMDECLQEEIGKKVYKIWLDAKCEKQLRARIHYKTGLFYMFTSLVLISVIAAFSFVVISAGWTVRVLVNTTLTENRLMLSLVAMVVAILETWLFIRKSRALLEDVISEGRVAMHLPENATKLKEVARAAIAVSE